MRFQKMEITQELITAAQAMLGQLAIPAACWFTPADNGTFIRIMVILSKREIPFHWRMYVSIIRVSSDGIHYPISEDYRDGCLRFLGLASVEPEDFTDFMDCLSFRYNAGALQYLNKRAFKGFDLQPQLHYLTGLYTAVIFNFFLWAIIVGFTYCIARILI